MQWVIFFIFAVSFSICSRHASQRPAKKTIQSSQQNYQPLYFVEISFESSAHTLQNILQISYESNAETLQNTAVHHTSSLLYGSVTQEYCVVIAHLGSSTVVFCTIFFESIARILQHPASTRWRYLTKEQQTLVLPTLQPDHHEYFFTVFFNPSL